jgi:hypothetical protein
MSNLSPSLWSALGGFVTVGLLSFVALVIVVTSIAGPRRKAKDDDDQ